MDHLSFLWVFVLGIFLGIVSMWVFHRVTLGSYKRIAEDILQKANVEADAIQKNGELTFKHKEIEHQKELDKLTSTTKKKLQKEEERIKGREDKLELRMNLIEKKLSDIDKREAIIIIRRERLEEEKKAINENQVRLISELEHVSGLTKEEAKSNLLLHVQNDVKMESALFTERYIKEKREESEIEASRIITTAINRIAASTVSEATVTTVSLPNDDIKGRIIGKEGRNIRSLELATGVNFLIDDTPGAVVISGFDPVRKHIAKMALTELVLDGRIHPTRIEEVVEKSTNLIQKQIKSYGEDAALRAGAMNLHPELITLLGKLKFRYSLGQNVLDHSIEVAHLMGIMAAELGLDVAIAKRIGLLHDFGKAVTHEVEGSHAIIGHDFALKFGETDIIANGIGCHHGEMLPISIEGSLCSAADALSAARPGARVEAVEHYIRRLQKLEEIANALPGVEKAYAMQAGREVRIIVHPDSVDDASIITLARECAKKVEAGLIYPGKIKVTVIREKRAIEYAL